MHFIINEYDNTDANLTNLLFQALKRDSRIECINKNDFLQTLLFIQGYKQYSEVEILVHSSNENDIVLEDSDVWEIFCKNRKNSTKKKTSGPEHYSFEPKTNKL